MLKRATQTLGKDHAGRLVVSSFLAIPLTMSGRCSPSPATRSHRWDGSSCEIRHSLSLPLLPG